MHKYPLIKYVLFFITGIIFQSIIDISLLTLTILLLLLIAAGIVNWISRKETDTLLIFQQAILIMLVMFSGASYFALQTQQQTIYPFAKPRITDAIVYGEVENIELIKGDKLDFIAVCDSIKIQGRNIPVQTKFIAKLKSQSRKSLDDFYNTIQPGNVVRITGTIQKGREQRNPFEFDYNKYLNDNGIAGLIYINSTREISVIDDENHFVKSIIFSVRKRIANVISQYGSQKTQALLRGLILADRSGIDYDVRENFVNAGVIHVLAVSGLHVGYIALIFLFLFTRFNIYVRYILTIAGLFLFVLITGAPPSVVRASVMASILILSYIFNRGYNNINSLALAALIILLLDPAELFNPGFQLSFSAVLSILLIYPKFKAVLNNGKISNTVVKNILLFVLVSLAAQIGTLPFTLYYFHKLSIIALLANLFVIPLIGVILGMGFVVLISSVFSSWLAATFTNSLDLASDVLFWIVNSLGSSESSHFYISQFTIYDGLVFYVLLITAFVIIPKLNSFYSKTIVMILIVLNYVVLIPLDNRELLPDGKLSVMMIDVGQGDSFLVKFPNGKTALIDAGNATSNFDNGERVIQPLLKNLGIEKIDYGFISHVDADHYKGFEFFIERRLVDTIYKPIKEKNVEKDSLLENLINRNDIVLRYYDMEEVAVGNCRIYVLNDTSDTRYKTMDSNNKSGILKVVYGNKSFLFVGDAEKPAENYILDKFGAVLDSDVLKIGHHGSNTSSSKKFVESVSPEVGLISAGMFNKFGHPKPEIIDFYRKLNIEIFRTDLSGAVILTCDGNKIDEVQWR